MTALYWNGPPGRALAAFIALLALVLIWFTTIAPIHAWFQQREILLDQRQAQLRQMRDIAGTRPYLRQIAANDHNRHLTETAGLLHGETDSLAAAELQERLQSMAASVGASLTTVETIPPAIFGDFHKVPLRISLNAPWPVLIDLLRSIGDSLIQVDEIQLQSAGMITRSLDLSIQASMLVYGFTPARAGPGT